MANAYKTVGNANPGTSLIALYTCPVSTEAVLKLVVCNRSAVDKKFRFALSPLGAAVADDHYWFYDATVRANDTIELDGLSFEASDVARCYGEDTTVSFNLNGVEIT
jgi:hypothetical protein